ncbi:MAG TPA: hypothetical protein VF595_09175 [Tepidisphaeraceae bacterium]|jgi:hypothetical protein
MTTRADVAAEWAWLLGQAGVLALFAGRIRLTGGFPEPVEASADLAVAVAQLILGVLLGPTLFRTAAHASRAGAVCVPFALLGSLLSGRPVGHTITLWTVAWLWLALIGRTTRWPMARFGLCFLTIAVPVLFYARNEYGMPSPITNWPWRLSPTLGVCATAFHTSAWASISVPAAGHIAVSGLLKAFRSRRPVYCNA